MKIIVKINKSLKNKENIFSNKFQKNFSLVLVLLKTKTVYGHTKVYERMIKHEVFNGGSFWH